MQLDLLPSYQRSLRQLRLEQIVQKSVLMGELIIIDPVLSLSSASSDFSFEGWGANWKFWSILKQVLADGKFFFKIWTSPGLFSDLFIAELFTTLITANSWQLHVHFCKMSIRHGFASGMNLATGGSPGLDCTFASCWLKLHSRLQWQRTILNCRFSVARALLQDMNPWHQDFVAKCYQLGQQIFNCKFSLGKGGSRWYRTHDLRIVHQDC